MNIFSSSLFTISITSTVTCFNREGVSPGFDFRDFKFVSFDELKQRVGEETAVKYRSFLHDDPLKKDFDAFYD